MKRRLAAASCISRQSYNSVWISDVLLTETFNRFCHPKRYGSSVPGPLEAQRRAAKRKNTNLAYTGSGGASVDPSVIFGRSATQHDWWRAPRDVAAVPAPPSRLLPSWLAFPSSKKQASADPAQHGTIPISPLPQKPSESHAANLSHCQTLAQVKEWITEKELRPREDAHIGRAILNHILGGHLEDHSVRPMAAYICDPTFHSPSTPFILEVVRAVVCGIWDPASWGLLRRSICSATELGLISVENVRGMIGVVLDATELRLKVTGVGPIKARARTKLYMVDGILDSLDRSPVLQITDLGTPLLSRIFSIAAGHVYLAWCEKLLWRLLPWAPTTHVPIMGQLVHNHLQFQRGQHGSDGKAGQVLADRLLPARPEFLRLLLVYTTESLLDFSKESKTMLYRFMWYHWRCALAVLGSQAYNVSLTTKTWQYLRTVESTLMLPQRSMAFAWTAMSLSSELRASTNLSDRLQFLNHFETLITSLPNASRGDAHHAYTELSDLALPDKDALLRNLIRLSLSVGEDIYHEGSRACQNIVSGMKEGITTSILDERIQNAHFNRHEELAEILHRANHGFPSLKILSRRMIHKSTTSFGILCQLVEDNTMLKAALQMPRSESLKPMDDEVNLTRSAASSLKDAASSFESRTIISNLPAREQVVGLIHHLAISFATSLVASPRSALRRVYWCYLFLCNYKVPIQPVMIRALWHAGVTRYGEGGTAATLLKWLLKRVRELEGEEIASRLLWSETFRLTRTAQIDLLSNISKEEEEALLGMLTEELTSAEDSETSAPRPDATTGSSSTSSSRQVHFSPEEIDALLTGDEKVDQEMRDKVRFLQFEPPAKPFWLPRERVQVDVGDDVTYSVVTVRKVVM